MTREEAINVMRKYTDTDSGIGEVIAESHKMAIKALEQENVPETNVGNMDYISRQAVEDAIYDYSRSCDVNYAQIMEFIDKLPSVTAEPKTGHWVIYDVHGHKACKCSECDKDVGYPCNYKYCPYCGHFMIKPQESEEKCKNCEYYINPDYTRCHECKTESEE